MKIIAAPKVRAQILHHLGGSSGAYRNLPHVLSKNSRGIKSGKQPNVIQKIPITRNMT